MQSLDDYLKLTQICFYSVVAAITVLTFLRARKGLLSTVNTEYHKKAIDRLDHLANTLLDEYDFDSANHWSKTLLGGDAVDAVNDEFSRHQDQIRAEGKFETGILESPQYARLSSLVQRIRSDPFIPREIRQKATDFLQSRAEVISEVHASELEKYCDQLAKGTYSGKLDQAKYVVHNRILSRLNERGCGISEIEAEVHNLRLAIQAYFDKFHP